MKAINILFLALNIITIMAVVSVSAQASVTYRMLSPSQMDWKIASKSPNNINDVCGAYNIFENEFFVHILKNNGLANIKFNLPNLIKTDQRVFETQLFFDNALIFSGALNNIVGSGIEFSLNEDHLNKLYQTRNIDLSVNTLGYSFDTKNIFQAQTIINECQVRKATKNNIQKSPNPIQQTVGQSVKPALNQIAPAIINTQNIQSDTAQSANIMDRLSVNLGENRVSFPVVDDVKPAMNPSRPKDEQMPVMAGKNISEEAVNRLSTNILSNDSTQQLLVDMLASKKEEPITSNENIVSDNPKDDKLFEEKMTSQIPNIKPLSEPVPTIKGPETTIPLTDNERELFESMKTKMFLLEREKQAVRNELTDIRQKEIEIMKVDIGSRYKIEEQAEKIELLQQKLEQYRYQQVNFRGEQDSDIAVDEEVMMDSVPVEDVIEAPLEILEPLPPVSRKKPEIPDSSNSLSNDTNAFVDEESMIVEVENDQETKPAEIIDVIQTIEEFEQKIATPQPVNDAQALEAIETEALEALKSMDEVQNVE